MKTIESTLERVIFASRWLQAPMYIGMVVVQGVYAYKYVAEVVHLLTHVNSLTEVVFMESVLALIDLLMIANLLTMVMIGGYTTFIGKLDFLKQEDIPGWLDHIDPGSLKVKLAGSLVGVSGVHLLKTFTQLTSGESSYDSQSIVLQMCIHIVFVTSTLLLTWGEYIMAKKAGH